MGKGKGQEIGARDMLIIWDCAAKGVRSPIEIQVRFEEEREPPHPDTIRKWIARYEDFLRWLPEYHYLCQKLSEVLSKEEILPPSLTPEQRRHFDAICDKIKEWKHQLEVIPEALSSVRGSEPTLPENKEGYVRGWLNYNSRAPAGEGVELFTYTVYETRNTNGLRILKVRCPIETDELFQESLKHLDKELLSKYEQWSQARALIWLGEQTSSLETEELAKLKKQEQTMRQKLISRFRRAIYKGTFKGRCSLCP